MSESRAAAARMDQKKRLGGSWIRNDQDELPNCFFFFGGKNDEQDGLGYN